MSELALGILALATIAVAALGTGWLRSYAIRRSLIDLPNSRSAHETPTPRGGGVAIVLAFTSALAVLAASGAMAVPIAVAIAGAGMIVALVGFWDDHGHIAARWRLLAHFVAASWLLAWLPSLPELELLGSWGVGAPFTYGFAAFLIVWMVNLYNFMDGIDGIASMEAITAALGGAIAAILVGQPNLAALPILLAAAVVGFLLWNWPPAAIFMGDVGSGFLGVVLAGLTLWSGLADPALLFAWVILLGIFVTDSGLTLLRRAARGERIYEAHRSHAYQNAARRLRSHGRVTIAVGVINTLWLLPLAMAVALEWLSALHSLLIAYVPVAALVVWFKAGGAERVASEQSFRSSDS